MNMTKSILVLSCLMLGLLSKTANANPHNFIQQREMLIRDLQSNSILPNKIIQDLARIKIVIRSDFVKKPSASRRSAFADFNNKQIILNGLADFSGDLTPLILHESLSAAGWLDINYEFSVVITQLLKDAKKPFLGEQIRKIYSHQLKHLRKGELTSYKINDGKLIDLENSTLASSEGGGAVIVGGGGDLKCAQIKEALLSKFNIDLAHNPGYQKRQYKSIVFGLKIETVRNAAYPKKIRVKSTYNVKRKIFERIFYVPDTVSQKQALKDIWFFAIFLGAKRLSSNTGDFEGTFDYYIPRNIMEKREFSKDPLPFVARDPR